MSDDLIRRSDAINALKSMLSDDINTSILFFWQNQTVGRGIDKIKNLPSEGRPQGEWIDKGKNLWKCSNCEMVIYSESEQDRNEFHKWCSRCGAQMKGADDE